MGDPTKEVRSSKNELLNQEAIHRIVTRKFKQQLMKYGASDAAELMFYIVDKMHKNKDTGHCQVDTFVSQLISEWEESRIEDKAEK